MRGKLRGTKRLTAIALLLTAAFILSWLEMILSLPMPLPGIKIGLANLAILFALYYCGAGDAFFVLTGRLILNAVLFGNHLFGEIARMPIIPAVALTVSATMYRAVDTSAVDCADVQFFKVFVCYRSTDIFHFYHPF